MYIIFRIEIHVTILVAAAIIFLSSLAQDRLLRGKATTEYLNYCFLVNVPIKFLIKDLSLIKDRRLGGRGNHEGQLRQVGQLPRLC